MPDTVQIPGGPTFYRSRYSDYSTLSGPPNPSAWIGPPGPAGPPGPQGIQGTPGTDGTGAVSSVCGLTGAITQAQLWAALTAALPTTLPATAGVIWLNGKVLCVS